jgi:hypothetical protein
LDAAVKTLWTTFEEVAPRLVDELVQCRAFDGFKNLAEVYGYELPLAYAVLGFVFAILGPGMYSLDALLRLSGVWNASVTWVVRGLRDGRGGPH